MKNREELDIHKLIKKVDENTTGIFERTPELIVLLPEMIAKIIGSSKIYLSEFIVAKVKGRIKGFNGHPEITNDVFINYHRIFLIHIK